LLVIKGFRFTSLTRTMWIIVLVISISYMWVLANVIRFRKWTRVSILFLPCISDVSVTAISKCVELRPLSVHSLNRYQSLGAGSISTAICAHFCFWCPITSFALPGRIAFCFLFKASRNMES
jgi:hypothetical protein